MALLPDKEKLLRNFLRCANWEEKYLYIIELGQRLPELRDEDRSPQNSIQGCQSQVWIVMRQNAQGIIELQGDSDAAIVKGLIAVVFILYDQMTPQDIVNFDVRPWFEKMALTQHLTPSRSQGVYTDLHRSVLVSGEHKRHPTFQRESPANTGGLQ